MFWPPSLFRVPANFLGIAVTGPSRDGFFCLPVCRAGRGNVRRADYGQSVAFERPPYRRNRHGEFFDMPSGFNAASINSYASRRSSAGKS